MTSFLSWESTIHLIQNDKDYCSLVHDAYYDKSLLNACERYYISTEFNEIRKHLPVRGRLLDVGAGRGISSYAFAKDGFDVVSLEPNSSEIVGLGAIHSLNACLENNISICCGYSEKIPLESESVDIVFVRAALHHSQDLYEACKEFNRVLKPNGTLFVAREHVISKAHDLSKFLRDHPLHHFYGGENAFLRSDYINAFKCSSFKLQKTLLPLESPINYSPYTKKIFIEKINSFSPSFFKFFISKVLSFLFKSAFFWYIVSHVFEQFDNRPGRLFSFILQKQ